MQLQVCRDTLLLLILLLLILLSSSIEWIDINSRLHNGFFALQFIRELGCQ
jgi:hypothetical protein